MNEILDLCKKINKCCRKIAERDGFDLKEKPEGGYIKKPNEYGGYWSFIEGPGKYTKKDGEMQWELDKC